MSSVVAVKVRILQRSRYEVHKTCLIAIVLLGACERNVHMYTVDQETNLHWTCVEKWVRCGDWPLGYGDGVGVDEYCLTQEDRTWFDTTLIHATGTIDDAAAKCYEEARWGFIQPIYTTLDSCYCLEEFIN